MHGFETLGDEIDGIAKRARCEQLKKKALAAGAEPIKKEAQNIARRVMRTRTGNLVRSIDHSYNPNTGRQSIGWTGGDGTGLGFYGFFHEVGYRVMTGRRTNAETGARLTVTQRRKTAGRSATIQHRQVRPALENRREQMQRAMVAVYKKELGGT